MEEKRTSLEVIAPSIEEAIADGLEDLGVPEEAVDVEILDIGSQGLFGIGSRHARVRLTVKEASVEGGEPLDRIEKTKHEISDTELETERKPEKEEQPAIQHVEHAVHDAPPELLEEAEEDTGEVEETPGSINEEVVLHVAQVTVEELLEKMGIVATVNAYHGEPDDDRSRSPLVVDIKGDDLSILIGPRAETLNALQYVTSLIIGKELGRSIPLVVDVEGYRKRRNQSLRRLAQQMAEQAVKSGRRQVLEPMPSNERRIIHIELRENAEVETESVGVEPRRKVTIIPVENELE